MTRRRRRRRTRTSKEEEEEEEEEESGVFAHRFNAASLASFYGYFHANSSSDHVNCIPPLI
ncbi:hypothetical protein E2C01_072019 [Portunus trituberculatus]|uniref:Uncharacterized protein n=1 Tax=Portunus trituberculatus TaxID=210409 RepID=A0A5B7I1H2_PORTR|nr:hypothetical protein [Portunus trituberculatus]